VQMIEWRFRDIRWHTNAGAHTPPEDRHACMAGAGCGCIRHRRNTRRCFGEPLFWQATSKRPGLCEKGREKTKKRRSGKNLAPGDLFVL
jgi:hypothetical protein